MQDKNDPGKENRTFETRLEFIDGIFSNLQTKEEILTSCIQFKLNMTYQQYLASITKSLNYLAHQDPDKIIKKL